MACFASKSVSTRSPIPLPLLCRPFIDIVLDRGAWFCAGNELVQSTREAIFGTTTNAALRLTEEDAEDWMRFLRFAIAFHLEAETRRAEEEPEPLKVRRSFGLPSLSL